MRRDSELTRREYMERRRRERRLFARSGKSQPEEARLRRTDLMASRREAARRKRRRRTWLPLGATLLLIACVLGSALAWFSTSSSLQATVSTGTWSTRQIDLRAGCARAPHVDPAHPGCVTLSPIATVDANGELSLDFGDQRRDRRVIYSDVFRVVSLTDQPLRIGFSVTGRAATLIGSVSISGSTSGELAPKQSARVAVQLRIPLSTPAGRYGGEVTVRVLGGTESYSMPVVIHVVAPAAFTLEPGSAKAPHLDPARPEPPESLPIASADAEGALSLDLGDQGAGQRVAYADVLRVVSQINSRMTLSFSLSGPAAQFIRSVDWHGWAGGQLAPHATKQITFKLLIPASAVPARYNGELVIRRVGSAESYSIPIVIVILGDEPLAPASASTEATETPGSSPSPTPESSTPPTEASPTEVPPSPSPSETPSGEPTATESPLPTASPTGDGPQPSPSDTGGAD